MKTFTNQLDLTAFWEGFSPTAYKDAAGVITLGYGQARTLPDGTPITPDMTCTEEQAREWLDMNLNHLYLTFLLDPKYKFNGMTEQIHSLSDYAYNCGINAFPRLIEKLKANDIPGAAVEFLDGFYVSKKPLLGLLLRRISEYNTFLTGQYIAFEKNDPITSDLKNNLLKMNQFNKEAIKMINIFKVK